MPVFVITPSDVFVGACLVLSILALGYLRIDAALRARRTRLRAERERS